MTREARSLPHQTYSQGSRTLGVPHGYTYQCVGATGCANSLFVNVFPAVKGEMSSARGRRSDPRVRSMVPTLSLGISDFTLADSGNFAGSRSGMVEARERGSFIAERADESAAIAGRDPKGPRSDVVGLGVCARLARLPARLMMITMTAGAERSQTIAYRTVIVVRVIVAAAKRLARLIALGEMSVYGGRGC